MVEDEAEAEELAGKSEEVPEVETSAEQPLPGKKPRGHRDKVAEPWGPWPWSISPVTSQGVQTGWGTTCRVHTNAGNGCECKKNFSFSTNTPDETKALCKQWLLMGRDIPKHSETGQLDHVHKINRNDIPLRTHAELDEEAGK